MTRITILDSDEIRNLYSENRNCIVRFKDGSIGNILGAFKMTLNYDKMSILLNSANIHTGHSVLNVFSGPGGVLRLASTMDIAELFGIDLLLPGYTGDHPGWIYAAEEAFLLWRMALKEKNYQCIQPVFVQGDVRCLFQFLENRFDRIIIDPPYGDAAGKVLGITELSSVTLLSQSIKVSLSYLKKCGEIYAIFPKSWMECEDIIFDRVNQSVNIIEKSIGMRKPLVIAAIRRLE